jgi:hypothetical protein
LSRAVHCTLCAAPIFQSCRCAAGVVRRHGSSIGSSKGVAAVILDRPLFGPDIPPNRAGSCERYALSPVAAGHRWSLLLSPLLSAGSGAVQRRRLDQCEVHVDRSTAELDSGQLIKHDPKSPASVRTVAFPKEIAPELRDHLERFAEPSPRGLVFIGPKGGQLRRSNFASSGTGPGEWLVFPNFTSMICGIPATRWLPRRGQAREN